MNVSILLSSVTENFRKLICDTILWEKGGSDALFCAKRSLRSSFVREALFTFAGISNCFFDVPPVR